MSNFDLVIPYDPRLEEWLRGQGYACPPVEPNNRLPSKSEIQLAAESSGAYRVEDALAKEFFVARAAGRKDGYEIRIGSLDWDRLGDGDRSSITMRGNRLTELWLLEKLSHQCGQLVLYPDTGEPCVIVAAGLDVDRVAGVWRDSARQPDSWRYFFANV